MWRPYIPAWSISSCMFKLQSKSSVIIIYAMYCHMIKEACGSESDTFWVGVRYLLVFGKSLISSKTPVDLDRISQHKKNETVYIGIVWCRSKKKLLNRYHYWLMDEDRMFGKCEMSSFINTPENKEKKLHVCSLWKKPPQWTNNCWFIVVHFIFTTYHKNIYKLFVI